MLLHDFLELENQFKGILTKEEWDLYLKLKDFEVKLQRESEYRHFEQGFKFGLLLGIESCGK